MTPTKALELVHHYSELQWAIRACKNHIAMHLDACKGLDGLRQERRKHLDYASYGTTMPASLLGDTMDGQTNEKQIHLTEWYKPEERGDYYSDPYLIWHDPDEDNQRECVHCYAAHKQIQKRKELRKQFGAVKAAITRTTPKPDVLKWRPEPENLE